MFFDPAGALSELRDFLDSGGNVLYAIMIATFFLWALIVERFFYIVSTMPGARRRGQEEWARVTNHKSWGAHQIRAGLISRYRQGLESNLDTIAALVALAPLLGLLGTVTGMIEVFDTLSFLGSANARAMAAGVSKATLPTMAGMTAALSGLFFSELLRRRAEREVQTFADSLELR
ncbi:MAG: MotA/TolQ/ExbB proton channel family protein [Alphaproteobacteria bacterium]|nr:MotA/TolQ/ExbB proton channel family protein [Alphaproteobacteria bacterium]